MSEAQDRGDGVREFSALLRGFKDRTDRSYGQLARRLNMNTSTLHRYCAGDAVPLDFAPVERFAALCGASSEERLELHRLWLLAVEERQRAREPKQEVPSEPDGPDEPLEETEPEVTLPAAPPSTRPWYRRRRVVVATAVAAALIATVGTLSALPSGRSASKDVAEAPAPSSGATASGTASRSPSPSASASSPTGSPSSKATGTRPSAKGTAGHTSGTGGTGGSGGQTGTGTPLTWTVDSHVWTAGCGHDYVIDKPPAEVPPPPVAQDAALWAATQGAVHGGDTNVRISVQGRNATAVVLEALRVRVVTREAPLKANSFAMEQGCGGALTPRYFSVNLDADRPIAHSESGNDGEHVIPAIQMPYRVSSTDPEVLLVTAKTVTCACSWYLELDWSSQGRTGTVRVDDDGRPFRTTGIKGLPRYWYGTNDSGQRGWVPYDG
ncbi:helix-turn-helix transcriptional regulator [Streptomyces sp. NPDC047072]|uniref:helix-turn-helix domain-containing protein n=1 Tax=Streptomyces sp. NPDC047072 TaxID=3154809 RepID=UPI00340B84FA